MKSMLELMLTHDAPHTSHHKPFLPMRVLVSRKERNAALEANRARVRAELEGVK